MFNDFRGAQGTFVTSNVGPQTNMYGMGTEIAWPKYPERSEVFDIYYVSTNCWCISYIRNYLYQYPVYRTMNSDISVNEAQNTAVLSWPVAGTPLRLDPQEKSGVLCCI